VSGDGGTSAGNTGGNNTSSVGELYFINKIKLLEL
jgi:hypothetical protein